MTPQEEDSKIDSYERQRRLRLLQAGLGLVAVFVAISFNVLYTGYSNQRDDQRWCSLMVSLDDRYQALPKENVSPDAAKFAAQIHQLRRDFKCAETTAPPVPSQRPSPTRS